MVLVRSSTGLLYRSDGTLTGWSGDAEWTSAADPQFVSWPVAVMFGPNADTEVDGVREGQLFIEGADWWLLYDAGDHVTPWIQFLAHSTDRGVSWTRLGSLSMGVDKIISGSWAAIANGWLEKRGTTYYFHRVIAATNYESPNVGLPGAPYYWDVWQNDTLGIAGWEPCPNVPDGNQRMDLGGAATVDFLPGSVVLDAGTYHGFCQMNTGSGYTIGLSTASAPDGPFDPPSSALATNATTGFVSRTPENAKVFYSSALGRWVCLVNLIATTNVFTDANAAGYSESLTDWSSAIWRMTQAVVPLDTDGDAVGLACHATGPDGALIEGPNGEVPVVFDTDPREYDPGWHLGRSIRSAVLEPSSQCFRLAQSANTNTYSIRRALDLTDAVIECAMCVTGAHVSGWGVALDYRSDATGANGYRAVITDSGAELYKVVGGSATLVAGPSGTITSYGWTQQRVKVSVVGNVHTITFQGEQQIQYTDSSSPIATGGYLGLSGHGVTVDVRALSVRTSDVLRVEGLDPSDVVMLRTYGELPVASETADGSGVAEFTVPHWPHYFIEVDGVDHTPTDDTLWGGDIVAVQDQSPPVHWLRA